MNRHCKTGIIWGFVAIPLLFFFLFFFLFVLAEGIDEEGTLYEIITSVLGSPVQYISDALGANIGFYCSTGLLDICKLIISFLIYYFLIGFTIGSVSSLIITRFSKNKAIPEQDTTS